MHRIIPGPVAAMLAVALLLPATSAVVAAAPRADAPDAPHIASPDWRDQVVYFLMIDRFDDGDPDNNDQGAGEFDPADGAKYSGGDLRGVARRIDYIRGLGATTVWITPPVANQWWNVRGRFSGYHGYWAENFTKVDAHYGTLDDYKALSRALHAAGLYLIQDVVLNHTANFFAYEGGWSAGDPAAHFVLHPDSRGRSAPSQPPFDRNDARDPGQRAAGIYHWTPDIADFSVRAQELTFQLAGLDDLNTENPVVRRALRASYGDWIREVGVDGFRVDTAFHVPVDYFADFLHADDADAPGILRVAQQTGRRDFHVFGEGFGTDKPYGNAQARKLDGYMRTPGGLPAMLNFPLYGTLGDVFARGRPTAELGYRIGSMMALHARPQLMPTFVDNHDVDRFLAGGSQAGLRQALLAIMTLPGIPTVYYGTEQGFTAQRAAMFAGGHGSAGRDRFDTAAPLYRFLQRAIALRREHRLFSRGTPSVLADNAAAPGVLAYRMTHGDAAAIVAFNSADRETLLDNLDTGLTPGTVLDGAFAIEGAPAGAVVGAGGRIGMTLPARSGLVWIATRRTMPMAMPTATLTLAPLQQAAQHGDFTVHGIARGVPELRLVVDGDVASAQVVRPGRDGRWQATVATANMIDPSLRHRMVAWAGATGVASQARTFTVSRGWTLLADVADPADDDAGPHGRYTYPDDPGWRAHRQADIRRVRVYGSGGALRIALGMREVSAPWNPANGFDHVAFTIFVQLPGRAGGAGAMPLQNATLPDGMHWHVRLRAHGWSNALFDATGASASNDGTPVTPSADIAVDAAHGTITFTLPGSALGGPASLSGAKLYVTTWDYDGGYRALTPQPQAATFGGGDGAIDALVMDDAAVITLR
ncbi:MAG: alpha-amylase family glycosyl hydrolase [Luteimonas sp.]